MNRLMPMLLLATFAMTPALAAPPPSTATAGSKAPTSTSSDSDSSSTTPALPVEVVPPATCKKPMVKSKSVRKIDDTSEADEAQDEYGDCMKAYIDQQNADAKAHVEAGNQAVATYNEFVKAVKAAQEQNTPN